MENDPVAAIAAIIDGKGTGQYGLTAINQRAHALQAALLAERNGCDAALITAALLHDIGHMVHGLGDNPAAEGIDDAHEAIGAAFLAAQFGPDVTEPIRRHVDAKRYLCAIDPGYFAKLSPDSVLSLSLQGGPMNEAEAAAFRARPHTEAAIQLRRFDESAKVKDLTTPGVDHFLPYMRACARAP